MNDDNLIINGYQILIIRRIQNEAEKRNCKIKYYYLGQELVV